MKKNIPWILSTMLTMLLCQFSSAQFLLNEFDSTYTQTFNTLATSGYNNPWADNSTLTGWYARTSVTNSFSIYAGQNGSVTNNPGLCAFGHTANNPIDRALGYTVTNGIIGPVGSGFGALAYRIKNNTGSTITSLTITYTGEQWRSQNNSAQSLTVEYKTGASLTDTWNGTWTPIPALTYTTTYNYIGVDMSNMVEQYSQTKTATITVNIPAGEEIVIRWKDLNDDGNDHLLAIDDVKIKANSPPCAAPTMQASSVIISNVGSTSWDVDWANGNGAGRVVAAAAFAFVLM